MNKTEKLDLGLDFVGHVATNQLLVENFKKLDAAALSTAQRTAISDLDPETATVEDVVNALQAL